MWEESLVLKQDSAERLAVRSLECSFKSTVFLRKGGGGIGNDGHSPKWGKIKNKNKIKE